MLNQDENSKLQTLMNVNKDASQFYGSAIEKVRNGDIRQTFKQMRHAHDAVVVDIQDYIRQKGDETKKPEATMIGEASQLWGELMSKITGDVDETLVTHLEEVEDRCLHSVQSVMVDEEIDPETRLMLQDKYAILQESHDHMKTLKEQIKRAA